jgi:ribosomal protein L11 methylase PrmA
LQKNYSEKNLINLKQRKFSKISYLYILKNFKNFIEKINLDKKKTTWSDYSLNNTYSSDQFNQKKNIIIEFVKKNSPKFLLDIGCNDGVYSEFACKNGADYVVGVDSDYLSINKAFQRSKNNKLNFLPLLIDFANPTPSLGWRQIERSSFIDRSNFDSIIALAVIHHLVIGKNLPLNEVIDVFMQISKNGIIEFVPKEDETVKYMLALREDIFFDYNIENFEKILATKAIIVNQHKLLNSNRVIFEYIKK